jgi:integrase
MPARKDASGTWRFQKVVRLPDGTKQRISGTPKINTKGDAERAERAEIARVLAEPDNRPEIPTFADFATRYMEVHARDLAPSEIAFKRFRLANYLNPMLGTMPVDTIGRMELDAIKVDLKDKSPSTVNNTLSVVGAILTYARKCRLIVERPELGMLEIPPQDFEMYTDPELEQLIAASTGFDLAGVLLGCEAGLRAGEIRALRREDVGAGKLRVFRSEWEGHIKAPKSGKARVVPMNARLKSAVDWALKQHASPTVLVRANGCSWTKESMRVAIARVTKAAGVENRGWHALRHAFCSRLAERGAPVNVIQALAGHASVTTTQRYMHVATDALEAATSLLERPSQRAYDVQTEEFQADTSLSILTT